MAELPEVDVPHVENTLDDDIEELTKKLKNYGLNEDAITLIMDRFVENKSFKEIRKSRGFLTRRTTKRFYELVLADLKAKGFK